MGAMNATGHVLVAAGAGDTDALWDLLVELCDRRGANEGPTVHAHTQPERDAGASRYCLHPRSIVEEEMKGDDLHALLVDGCLSMARELPTDLLWRRD